MKRFTLSISAISLTSLGLLFASACSSDDTTSDGEGGYVGSGGNTYMNRGGSPGYGGATGNGGAVGVGGKAATGGAVGVGGKAATGGVANAGAATGGKASTGGASTGGASTGGAATAGNAGNGGTAGNGTGGAATAGNAGKGGTAGSTSTGGASTAGNAGKVGTAGTTSAGGVSVAGSTSTSGTANAGTAGKTSTGTAGNAGAGTAGSGPACATDSTPPANGFCTPPASLANLPSMSGKFGNYFVNTTSGSAHIYNVDPSITTPVDGDVMTSSPYNTDPCKGAGVDASGMAGMSVTVTNNLAAPVDVLLYVIDQTGTTAPYTVVTLTARTTIAANATNLTVQVPFVGASSQFAATCTYSSSIALNLATVRQVGVGFDSANNQVDVWLLGMAFY